MSATTLMLTVEPGALDAGSSWAEFESLAAQMSREVGVSATPGQAHNTVADMAAVLTGTDGTLGPGRPAPDVVMGDGIGTRAGTTKSGVSARTITPPPDRKEIHRATHQPSTISFRLQKFNAR